jgi:hypothetical protein
MPSLRSRERGVLAVPALFVPDCAAFSDRLAEALKNLDIADAASVRSFKRTIRDSFAGFLRFTHRYWFHEVSGTARRRSGWGCPKGQGALAK